MVQPGPWRGQLAAQRTDRSRRQTKRYVGHVRQPRCDYGPRGWYSFRSTYNAGRESRAKLWKLLDAALSDSHTLITKHKDENAVIVPHA